MKRFIAILCILATMVCFTACGKEYTVYEVGGNDSVVVQHKDELTVLQTKREKIDTKHKTITYNYNGKDYELKYNETTTFSTYNSSRDMYMMYDGRLLLEIGINPVTGRIDFFSWLDKDYAKTVTDNVKTRDDCFEICKEYLSNYVDDLSEYRLYDEKYDEYLEIGAKYEFKFKRYIDDIPTSDLISIGVTAYGDVLDHRFECLGGMKNAKRPSDSEMKDIRKSVSKKLDKIYEPVKDKYDVTIGEEELLFMRLADGRYALQFTYENLQRFVA